MSGWADLKLTHEEISAWLETQLAIVYAAAAIKPKVYRNGAPRDPAGPYVVTHIISQPRSGAPWAGMTDAGLTFQTTSVAWDTAKQKSTATQAEYLGADLSKVIAATNGAGAPLVAHPALTGVKVLRRESLGDGSPEKTGDIWSWVESFRLDLTAA